MNPCALCTGFFHAAGKPHKISNVKGPDRPESISSHTQKGDTAVLQYPLPDFFYKYLIHFNHTHTIGRRGRFILSGMALCPGGDHQKITLADNSLLF